MSKFEMDFMRYSNTRLKSFRGALSIMRDKMLKGLYYARLAECGGAFSKLWAKKSAKLFASNNNEIGNTQNIQGGLCLIHPYGVTINSRARIGENFTIFKGATVGSIRSGIKKGTPTIGDRVTVCANAFVCGNIVIGNDVLIAANAFVNFDVPSNSIVIGNPGVIHAKTNPSQDYL